MTQSNEKQTNIESSEEGSVDSNVEPVSSQGAEMQNTNEGERKASKSVDNTVPKDESALIDKPEEVSSVLAEEKEDKGEEASSVTSPESTSKGEEAEEPVSFSSLNLPELLLKAIKDLGFASCTPIQGKSLPVTLDGHDVIGKAQTGTGKTAAFLITIITDLLNNPIEGERYIGEPRALIIAPTRELVMQIAEDARGLLKYAGLRVLTLVGGIDYEKQLRVLDKEIVDIVVATPGRLLDFSRSKYIDLSMVELMVIDEADRMLDMGFIPQVKQIVNATPNKDCRQTLLFSATFTDDIMSLAERWAVDPIRVEVAPERVATDTVDQKVYLVTAEQKYNLLYHLIKSDDGEKIIVFSNRRDQVRNLADKLHRHGLDVGLLSGEVSQPKRVKTLEAFKNGAIQVLVATDVAGRGLHIDDITHVVNFTLPEEADDYVHRIGRTGRAGATGTSVSFACEDDSFILPEIEEKLGMKLPCEHPEDFLLQSVPGFVRPSHFKKEGGSRDNRNNRSKRR